MIELTDFYADWCGPCQMMKPIFEEVRKEFAGKVSFREVNIDNNMEETEKFGIMSVPTFVILKDGVEVGRKVGGVPKEVLVAWLEESLRDQT